MPKPRTLVKKDPLSPRNLQNRTYGLQFQFPWYVPVGLAKMFAFLSSAVLTTISSVGLTASFYAVCVVCDGYLVPAVEVFIQQLRIPEDIAGVTFVAFGSAAPELFLNMVAAFENDSSDLSLPAVLGSAVIAFALIPSLCILCSNHKEDTVQLSAYPIIRETGFYLMGLATFCMAIQDGEVEYEEALGLILVYIVYVGSVAGFFIMASVPGASSPYSSDTNFRSCSDDGQHTPLVSGDSALTVAAAGGVEASLSVVVSASSSKNNSVKSPSPSIKSRSTSSAQWVANSSSANFNSNSNSNSPAMMMDRIDSEDVEEVQGATSGSNGDFRLLKLVLKSLWDYITAPVSHIVTSLIPPLIVVSHDPDTKKPIVSIRSAVCSLSACVVAISVSAYAIIFFTKLLVAQIGVGTTTVGATLVSLGAEIPDTISSISLARNGHHDGAMAGAIGSQVINITLGVGLPALISCWLYGGSLLIEPAQIKR